MKEERRGREERRDGQTSAKSYFFVSLCKLFYKLFYIYVCTCIFQEANKQFHILVQLGTTLVMKEQ